MRILFLHEKTARQVSTRGHHDNSGNSFQVFQHDGRYGIQYTAAEFLNKFAADIVEVIAELPRS
jgi:hypothetical protein